MFYYFSWRGFHWPNYHNFKFRTTAYDGNLFCENVTLPTMMSLRYLGPLDVSTPSFSVYAGTYESNWGGEEKTFTGLRANDFGFPPKGITITGGSSWTVFSNNNYTGTATCYNSSLLIYNESPLRWIMSAEQGCQTWQGTECSLWDIKLYSMYLCQNLEELQSY